MSDFPIPANEKQRLKALDSCELLNSLSEAEYDRLTELASAHLMMEKIIKACDELQVNHRLVKPVKMQDIYNMLSRLYIKEKDAEAKLPEIKTIPASASAATNILVAEDNVVNMFLVKTILKRILPNANVIEAKTGLEALAYCETKWPDLILMDVQMPEMNGYDATREIRALEHSGHVPIIALTAGNVKGEKEKCLAVGMDDFAVKPIIEETLAQLLNNWLQYKKPQLNAPAVAVDHDSLTHFNIGIIKNFVDDDPDLLNEVISLTKQELTTSLSVIDTQINNNDLKGLNLSGHKLYGTSASAGLPVLAEIAHKFEYMGNFTADNSKILFDELQQEIAIILTLL